MKVAHMFVRNQGPTMNLVNKLFPKVHWRIQYIRCFFLERQREVGYDFGRARQIGLRWEPAIQRWRSEKTEQEDNRNRRCVLGTVVGHC